MECNIWLYIREMNQDGTLGKMWPVRPLQVNDLLKKHQGYVWHQYGTSLGRHSLVGPFQFGTRERKKLKYPNMIDDEQWKE